MKFDRTEYILKDTPLKKDLLRLFRNNKDVTILDIGGCEGEESIRYSRLFPNAKIFIFEPLPSNQELIRKNLLSYHIKNVTLIPVALSDADGKSKFYVSSGHPENHNTDLDWDFGNKSSSLLEPQDLKNHQWLEFKDEIIVPTMTLNSFLEQNSITKIDFIHMDVQGAELKVLKGAKDKLKDIKAIWLEVADVSIYKNQVLRKEVEAFMKINRFSLVKSEMDGCSGDQFYIKSDDAAVFSFLSTLKKTLKQRVLKRKTLNLDNFEKVSYAQSGEDLIVKFIFDCLAISKPSYIDIGAHHPKYISNTALFYENGSTGINIEPDPTLFKEFLIERKNDINLNIGVSDTNDDLDFYVISSPTLNTFSKAEADKYIQQGDYHIVKTEKIKVRTLSFLIEKYSNGIFPQFLSIDAEGVDELIIKQIDFESNYPIVICIETISFSTSGDGVKNKELINFIESKGYMIYADTYINTIFVKKSEWENFSK